MDSVTPVDTAVKADSASGSDEERARLRESLSALMDDEADELELRRVLREVATDAGLTATWKRYHAVRASLRQEIHRNPSIDLLSGINARLAAEAGNHPVAPVSRMFRSGVLRYLGQGAIAASFALAALMSVSLLETAGNDAPAADIAQAGGETPVLNGPVLSGEYSQSELARTAATDAESLDRLERAVRQAFEAEEIPVSYNPEFPVQPSSNQ